MSKCMLRVVGELIGGSIQVADAGYYLTPVPLSLSEHLRRCIGEKEVYCRVLVGALRGGRSLVSKEAACYLGVTECLHAS